MADHTSAQSVVCPSGCQSQKCETPAVSAGNHNSNTLVNCPGGSQKNEVACAETSGQILSENAFFHNPVVSEREKNQSKLKCNLEACVDSSSVKASMERTKCLEKLNGLTHNEHSTGDNGLIVNILSTCCKDEASESHSYSGDSGRGSGSACQCTETDCDDVSCDETGQSDKHPSGTQSEVKHNEVDVLLNELEKTSLNNHRNSSEPYVTPFVDVINGISYVVYESEKQMPDIMRLITKDLSEPYSIYTYRYFIHNWPKLCFLAMADDKCVGAIVCKLDLHKKMVRRGYIAMLAVDSEYRRRQIGSTLVTKAIEAMIMDDCDEVVLETEITNQGALRLYENLGFVRDKRLFRYYLNGVDALRLKLWLR